MLDLTAQQVRDSPLPAPGARSRPCPTVTATVLPGSIAFWPVWPCRAALLHPPRQPEVLRGECALTPRAPGRRQVVELIQGAHGTKVVITYEPK